MNRCIGTLFPLALLLLVVSCGDSSPDAPADNRTTQQLLSSAQTWMYQLQEMEDPAAVNALASSSYQLLVLEPTRINRDNEDFDLRGMLQRLRTAPDGSRRLLLAYINIGQAEDYRSYWKSDWRAPSATSPGSPGFIVTTDPDGWSGNYPVAFWDTRWQSIWLGDSGLVAQLAGDGFDGVYLDWVEAYDNVDVVSAATVGGVNPVTSMIEFIERIRLAGRAVRSDFLVVPQNAPYLIDADPTRYLATIDALAVEDTWFGGTGDAGWDDPAGGDIPNDGSDEYGTAGRLVQYKKFQQAGKPVFSVDYCLQKKNADSVYAAARAAGLRPLVTRVALSRITGTPP